jgi:hypothetical protein
MAREGETASSSPARRSQSVRDQARTPPRTRTAEQGGQGVGGEGERPLLSGQQGRAGGEARVVAAIEQRMAVALAVASRLLG